jgi:hypothetical protein
VISHVIAVQGVEEPCSMIRVVGDDGTVDHWLIVDRLLDKVRSLPYVTVLE